MNQLTHPSSLEFMDQVARQTRLMPAWNRASLLQGEEGHWQESGACLLCGLQNKIVRADLGKQTSIPRILEECKECRLVQWSVVTAHDPTDRLEEQDEPGLWLREATLEGNTWSFTVPYFPDQLTKNDPSLFQHSQLLFFTLETLRQALGSCDLGVWDADLEEGRLTVHAFHPDRTEREETLAFEQLVQQEAAWNPEASWASFLSRLS